MNQLQNLLIELESYISFYEKENKAVSQSTIGWQIDHSFLVINMVVSQIKKSNPNDYKWRFNKNRFLVFVILRKIPRGKVRAPKAVQPFEKITLEHLKSKLEITRNTIAELDSLETKNYFTHPFMGDLNLKATIRFLELHTHHHLKITKDMLA